MIRVRATARDRGSIRVRVKIRIRAKVRVRVFNDKWCLGECTQLGLGLGLLSETGIRTRLGVRVRPGDLLQHLLLLLELLLSPLQLLLMQRLHLQHRVGQVGLGVRIKGAWSGFFAKEDKLRRCLL